MKRVLLKLINKTVPIYVGNDIINKTAMAKHIKHKDVVIITNTKIAKLHLNKIKQSLNNFTVKTLILPDGSGEP